MRDEQDRPARIKRESGGPGGARNSMSRHARAVNMPQLSVIPPPSFPSVGFPFCFAAAAAQRDRCNHAFIKMLVRLLRQSTATSLV